MRARRVTILISSLVLAAGVAGCGNKPRSRHIDNTDNTASYVDAGQISYQLQISRELNGFSTEDSQYLTGLPKGTAAPTPDEEWFAVFMWAWNQSKVAHYTAPASAFDVVDTQGTLYHPETVNHTVNPYAWSSQQLPPGGTQPAPDTTAFFGPTQGQLLLFKINASAYTNRPLTLQIRSLQGQVQASIPLDQ